jgi:hypothetical protein
MKCWGLFWLLITIGWAYQCFVWPQPRWYVVLAFAFGALITLKWSIEAFQ